MSVIGRCAPFFAENKTYATWNPSDKAGTITLSNGNLTVDNSATSGAARSTIGKSSGRWQWEYVVGTNGYYGLGQVGSSLIECPGYDANSASWNKSGTFNYNVQSIAAQPLSAALATGAILTFAVDCDAKTMSWYVNGVIQLNAYNYAPYLTGALYPICAPYSGTPIVANFGASPLAFPVAGYNLGLYE